MIPDNGIRYLSDRSPEEPYDTGHRSPEGERIWRAGHVVILVDGDAPTWSDEAWKYRQHWEVTAGPPPNPSRIGDPGGARLPWWVIPAVSATTAATTTLVLAAIRVLT